MQDGPTPGPGSPRRGFFLPGTPVRPVALDFPPPQPPTGKRGYGASSRDQRNAAGFPFRGGCPWLQSASMSPISSKVGSWLPDEQEQQLYRELLEFERIGVVSDSMRELIEDVWPELAHKLPPEEEH
jgi:hypothetical protein